MIAVLMVVAAIYKSWNRLLHLHLIEEHVGIDGFDAGVDSGDVIVIERIVMTRWSMQSGCSVVTAIHPTDVIAHSDELIRVCSMQGCFAGEVCEGECSVEFDVSMNLGRMPATLMRESVELQDENAG